MPDEAALSLDPRTSAARVKEGAPVRVERDLKGEGQMRCTPVLEPHA
jgi:hypothetical protein